MADDECEDILKQGIVNKIVQIYQTTMREIKTCQNALKMQFNDIEIMQQRWFALNDAKRVQKRYVTRLAIYISRLLNGMVHYEVNNLIDDDDFDASVPYLETVSIFD